MKFLIFAAGSLKTQLYTEHPTLSKIKATVSASVQTHLFQICTKTQPYNSPNVFFLPLNTATYLQNNSISHSCTRKKEPGMCIVRPVVH